MKKATTLWIIPILCLLMLCSCGKSPEEQWQEQYDLGVRYLSEGNYEEAIIAFTAAIEIDPNRAEAYVGRGDAYVASGENAENLNAALSDYEAALELDNTILSAWLSTGEIHVSLGNYEDAIEAYNRALELDPSQAEIYLNIAECYAVLGDLPTAIDILEEGIAETDSETLKLMLQEYENRLTPEEITVLTRQSYVKYDYISDGEFGDTSDFTECYTVYKYDENGYLVHEESWRCGHASWSSDSGEWILTNSTDFVYNQEIGKWVKNEYRRYGEEIDPAILEQHSIGTRQYTTGSDGNVCITCHPYPEERSEIIYNSEYNDNDLYDYDWYSAKYTYDADGNAISIESYSIDGVLLGICELEYEVLQLR